MPPHDIEDSDIPPGFNFDGDDEEEDIDIALIASIGSVMGLVGLLGFFIFRKNGRRRSAQRIILETRSPATVITTSEGPGTASISIPARPLFNEQETEASAPGQSLLEINGEFPRDSELPSLFESETPREPSF